MLSRLVSILSTFKPLKLISRLLSLKSDTCSISIPELELELSSEGTGRYTTVEGLIENMKEQLKASNPFIGGDSVPAEIRDRFENLQKELDNLIGRTLILDDPCGNSFIQGADKVEPYERTWQQNEDLGINDMKTEDYAAS